MAGLLEQLSFAGTFGDFDFLQPSCRVREFSSSYQARGDDRPRMQAHGDNERVPYYPGLPLHQEGLLLGATPEEFVAVRDELATALLGRLDVAGAPATSNGRLTIRYAGWTESASADVLVVSYEPPLTVSDGLKTGPYMIAWKAYTPYFLGDDSELPYYL
jgi:hypothetical protein